MSNKLHILLFFSVFISILNGCDETAKPSTPSPKEAVKKEKKSTTDTETPTELTALEEKTKRITPKIEALDAVFLSVPFYTEDEHFFYVSDTKWSGISEEKLPKNRKWGLATADKKIVLPIAYDKLYTPHATTQGYLEIEQNGKVGLIHLTSYAYSECKYETLFPPISSSAIAVAKKGHQLFHLDTAFQETALTREEAMQMQDNISAYKLDLNEKQTYLYLSYLEDMMYDGGIFLYHPRTYITPSYLYQLKLAPEAIFHLNFDLSAHFGNTALTSNTSFFKKVGNSINGFLTTIYSEGVDGRGWEIEQKKWVTIDTNLNVTDEEIFWSESVDFLIENACQEMKNEIKWMNDSILQVRRQQYDRLDKKYDDATSFDYYLQSMEDTLQLLTSNRDFPQTQFVVMDESHFCGCFFGYRKSDQNEDITRAYLDTHDLDIMRNEIFADYGYRFKTPKWQEYFHQKDWYVPIYDNVDDRLSAIEKTNIKTILEMRQKMVDHPEQYAKAIE